MATFFTIAVIVLIFLIIFQIAKASEYVQVLRGEEKSRKDQNKVNGFFMIAFLIAGLIGVYLCDAALRGKTLLVQDAASEQGERVDFMLNITLIITGIVFIITQVLLFYFAYRYQASDKRKAFYFPHNNKLEVIWTVIPAIALTALVVFGLKNWFYFTSEAPKNSLVVEITGKQFNWIYRYSGNDNIFGKRYYKNIDDAKSNFLGQDWADSKNFDDIVSQQTMYIVKNKPVKLIIGSRDVIHDVGMVHFRLKMDAVPGTPTTLWFTPKYTTKEMREKTGNPDFQYEISCDQMCGKGHYSMKGVIEVVTQSEFDLWMAQQKPNYFVAFPDKDPSNQTKPMPSIGGDSTKTAAGSSANGSATIRHTKM